MSEIFIVSNDRFFLDKKNFFNSNKNTFTIINCFKKLRKVYLIARKSAIRLKFKNKINNIELLDLFGLFKILNLVKQRKIIVVSLTPYNFLISFIMILLGIKKKNIFLFLRSDGFIEYKIKFGLIGYLVYGVMFNLLKKNITILSCSKSLTGVNKPKLIFPSEITNSWLQNRKKNQKVIFKNKTINLLYLGRFRKEKGYESLINLVNELKMNVNLKMVGNDFKYLKKAHYPKNKKIKIFGQISSNNKLIKFFDQSDIFILPSYIEAYPQVILESLSRLKPIIIFNEIQYLKKTFPYGLYNCKRNKRDFEKKLKMIIKNYEKIQISILKKKIYTLENFTTQINKILLD
tara:strand:+ start:21897 stop:22937 length:1041 start_codon:yes stop_codon:yes gene_type:complete